MPTFTGAKFSNFYKNLLGINQTSNTGVDSTVRTVQDGAGNDTALSLGTRQVRVIGTHDVADNFTVADSDGNNVLAVDTNNSKILGGASQTALNTQYAYFGTGYVDTTGTASYAADTHYAIQFGGANSYGALAAGIAMGNSTSSSFNDTNPASSLTISTTAMDIVSAYWFVMDNITIDAVKWLHAADAATGDITAAHLMTYTLDRANGTTSGDLASGTVVADGATIVNAGYEQIHYQAMTVQSADVNAGNVILFTFASDTVNSDFSINATVKYHIR